MTGRNESRLPQPHCYGSAGRLSAAPGACRPARGPGQEKTATAYGGTRGRRGCEGTAPLPRTGRLARDRPGRGSPEPVAVTAEAIVRGATGSAGAADVTADTATRTPAETAGAMSATAPVGRPSLGRRPARQVRRRPGRSGRSAVPDRSAPDTGSPAARCRWRGPAFLMPCRADVRAGPGPVRRAGHENAVITSRVRRAALGPVAPGTGRSRRRRPTVIGSDGDQRAVASGAVSASLFSWASHRAFRRSAQVGDRAPMLLAAGPRTTASVTTWVLSPTSVSSQA